MNLFYAAFGILAGLYIALTGYSDHSDYEKLKKYGVEVVSEPLTDYVERTKGGRTVGYSVTPKFKTESGSMGSCSGSVDKAMIDRLENTEPTLKVRYLSSNPSVCQVEGADEKGGWFVTILGTVMFLGAGAYLFNYLSAQRS